jgi:GNAT superfamily N-acetyltransferase
MSAFTIRPATPDDAVTILGFIQGLADYEREPDAVEVDEPTLRAQMESADPPFECLLADTPDGAIGFALFFRTYSTWKGKPGIWLEDLFVPPEHRGKGAGFGLLRRIAEIAVERDYGRVEWSVLDWNQLAIDFYRRLGAVTMDEWNTNRLTGAALTHLARGPGVGGPGAGPNL